MPCRAFVRFGLVGLPTALAFGVGCEGEYSLAPTLCDDWCVSVQRADCHEDRPDDCVSDCERENIGRAHPECEPEWRELSTCYANTDDARFSCVEGDSRPNDDVCVEERVSLGNCVSERQGLCTELCIREHAACGEQSWRCEPDCAADPPGCDEEYSALYRCKLSLPGECEPDETPCFEQILEALDCPGSSDED